MGEIFMVILMIIIGITLAISLWKAISAASQITNFSGWENDSNLAAAHKRLSWTSAVVIVAIVLLVIAIVLIVSYGSPEEAAESKLQSYIGGPNYLSYFMYFILFFLFSHQELWGSFQYHLLYIYLKAQLIQMIPQFRKLIQIL